MAEASICYLVPVIVNLKDGRVTSVHVDDDAMLNPSTAELLDGDGDYTLETAHAAVLAADDWPIWQIGW